MNKEILDRKVQEYIVANLRADVHRIAMGKSRFSGISSRELAEQIAAKKKSEKKLPTWYQTELVYYPPLLSIEQCSSETTAAYKAKLIKGTTLIDLTGGFGVDSYYFAKVADAVTHCEINPQLSEIARYNAGVLGQKNMQFLAGDGIAYLSEGVDRFDSIYIDPARRSSSGKVFMLRDCTPNVVEHLDLLLERSSRIIIKTAPLLDISAGLKELNNVAEIHIISTKNEVKELLWVIDKSPVEKVRITAVTLNDREKIFSFYKGEEETEAAFLETEIKKYLYEPDAALLKSGAFNLISSRFHLEKLDANTQLYHSDNYDSSFPGRIFKINSVISSGQLKKEKGLSGNVIVRNYPDKAEHLVKKYKIKADQDNFLIFTQSKKAGNVIINATIQQHY
ncbi:THUMP-like domain-containing protein [Pedobacter frigoris]|uniref:Uncharacterized protein n=1 Tax=Pedobacter frigoris TaxID=2571272 RepID=A0A4U1CJ70_9SPHI|nr:hypothetical protein [Pedobacter frigoris]TKC06126.1 hypothetical protein FA047_12425 [Pedobacter frigoris]